MTWSLSSSGGVAIEAATEAPAERTVEATEPAFEDTVLRQEEIIRSELGSSPLRAPPPPATPPPPLPRFIASPLSCCLFSSPVGPARSLLLPQRFRLPLRRLTGGPHRRRWPIPSDYWPDPTLQTPPTFSFRSLTLLLPSRLFSARKFTKSDPTNLPLLLFSSSSLSLYAVAFVCLSPSLTSLSSTLNNPNKWCPVSPSRSLTTSPNHNSGLTVYVQCLGFGPTRSGPVLNYSSSKGA